MNYLHLSLLNLSKIGFEAHNCKLIKATLRERLHWITKQANKQTNKHNLTVFPKQRIGKKKGYNIKENSWRSSTGDSDVRLCAHRLSILISSCSMCLRNLYKVQWKRQTKGWKVKVQMLLIFVWSHKKYKTSNTFRRARIYFSVLGYYKSLRGIKNSTIRDKLFVVFTIN